MSAAAGADQPHGPAATPAADSHVPAWLRHTAAWSWRLLLVAAVAYLVFKVAVVLRLLVLPLIAAMLLSALLQPLTARLRRAGMPALAATWVTILLAIGVLAGVGTLIANRVQADYPKIVTETRRTVHEVQRYLAGPPFRLSGTRIDQLSAKLLNYLAQHKTLVAGTVVTGGRYFIEVLTGLILTVFITFFLLKDGHRIWSWLISGLHAQARVRADQAGGAAWQALVGYIRGTTAVAAIHGVFIGLALWLLGVPLLVPLVILVFLAAYVPLVGILVAGSLAVLVTLATRGWVAAVILIAVFLAENQLESHLLQPLVVGRIVRLHPLAIIVVLAIGGIVAGVPGAIVAVPTTAMIAYAWPYLRGDHVAGPPAGGLPRTQDETGPIVEAIAMTSDNDRVQVLIKRLDQDLPLPRQAHPGDAGVDLYAAADVELGPGERAIVPAGIAIALPDGYAAFVQPRSGLAARHGVTVVNAPGTVDAGYRGEIRVTMLNTDRRNPVRFRRGDRIAQLVIQRVERPAFCEVTALPGSARGEDGFGSTGGHAGVMA